MKNLIALLGVLGILNGCWAQEDLFDKVAHHYALNNGVKIHYVSLGEGPVLIMLHGFPDFWYTWRHQMNALSKEFKVVAVDLRGYNKSDKPRGVENYSMRLLMKDVISVIDDLGVQKATLIANDWGGAIAWQVATYYPDRVNRYIACNMPHPNGLRAYLANNPQTGKYAQDFKKEESDKSITPQGMVDIHKALGEEDKRRYLTAFENSSITGMLNYYKANYPAPLKKDPSSKDKNSVENTSGDIPQVKKVQCPVLMIYGMKDSALPPGMINNTWEWVDNEVTILTLPEAGHFVQQEAHQQVTEMIRLWLGRSFKK